MISLYKAHFFCSVYETKPFILLCQGASNAVEPEEGDLPNDVELDIAPESIENQPTEKEIKTVQIPVIRGLKRPYMKKKRTRTNPLEGNFKCPHCPFIGTTGQSLRLHVTHHAVASEFRCQSCSYSTKAKLSLTAHVNRVHPELHQQQQQMETNPPAVDNVPPVEEPPAAEPSRDQLKELDREIREGYEALRAATRSSSNDERSREESLELGRLLGRKEMINRRLAELPQQKMVAEIELRKLQCVTLKMRMWVLQQSADGKEDEFQPNVILETALEHTRQSEETLKALEAEKQRLESERDGLSESIRLMEENSAGPPTEDRFEELFAEQRRRIFQYFGLKQQMAFTAFQKEAEGIERDLEDSLKDLNSLTAVKVTDGFV